MRCRCTGNFLRDRRLAKPLIAAVEGSALGGSTECSKRDLRVAGRSAQFGLTEVKWGFPLGGSTARLPKQIPYTCWSFCSQSSYER